MRGGGPEYQLAEKPCLDGLKDLGYDFLNPKLHDEHRDGENNVLLRPILIDAIQRINGVSEQIAEEVYRDLLRKKDNEEWTQILRGNYSRTVSGEATKKTLLLIDFLNPKKNTFTVTNQFRVRSEKTLKPDLVIFVNGIPLVVIEAKSPVAEGDKSGPAFDQIKQYERDIPRLFYSNAFNIIADGRFVLYGATGAPSEHWSTWKDPWPKTDGDFGNDPLTKGLYCLLEPSRLLDILAHFIVFERNKETKSVIKKICRYPQYRAVNKIVNRVTEGKHKRGLIWHTQGSGKSLTMVFAALKLKTHLTIQNKVLENPNILVLTDRIDLDDQISNTFVACGLRNPEQPGKIRELQEKIHAASGGLTLLSTIFKFEGSRKAVENSSSWILLVDECHRTQEKDLGAYLRATLPDAHFFGFTGTPIQKNDRDTYETFGANGEGYLDRYSIDDAIEDGATVPIYFTGRKTEWQIEGAKLDVLFDQWFAKEPPERVKKLKQKGVEVADLVKHPERIDLIAYDIWTHFKENARPDGLKAQIVAVDREAIILYKRALDRVIADDLVKEGQSQENANRLAAEMSACVYSQNQEDAKPSEDQHTESIRNDLVKHYLDQAQETEIKAKFLKKTSPPSFLIVCNKLLTGFDAPVEGIMYLDSPLKEHNLLQAIARTNRTHVSKQNGLIVDYIGISRELAKAFSTYHEADIQHAMRDLDELRAKVRAAHREVMAMMKPAAIGNERRGIKAEYDALVQALGTEDVWFTFRRKAKAFIAAYAALSPDPAILEYTRDLKWVANFIRYATQAFEKRESLDHLRYSEKIRAMLEEHLHVTGLTEICKIRNLTDREFWEDFSKNKKEEDLVTAAIRKSTELKKILYEKVTDNPLRYGPFSERVMELIRKFEEKQIEAAQLLLEFERVAKDLQAEESAHKASGLDARTYDIYKILEAFREPMPMVAEPKGQYGAGNRGNTESGVADLARAINDIYSSDRSAPPGWHLKEQLRKELRQKVRGLINDFGLKGLKEIPAEVESFALKNYVKVS